MLIEKKYQMYERELKMQQLLEQDELSLRKIEAEFRDSDEEAEGLPEENFVWYQDPDPDNFFVLTTMEKNFIEKDTQVFICYGRRSNRYLLSGYGFGLPNNKYNTLSFRIWLDFRPKDQQQSPDDS